MPEEGAGTRTTTEEEGVVMIEEEAGTTVGVEEGGITIEVEGHRIHPMVVSGTEVDEVGMGRGIIITVAARGTTTIVGDTTVAATVGMMIKEA